MKLLYPLILAASATAYMVPPDYGNNQGLRYNQMRIPNRMPNYNQIDGSNDNLKRDLAYTSNDNVGGGVSPGVKPLYDQPSSPGYQIGDGTGIGPNYDIGSGNSGRNRRQTTDVENGMIGGSAGVRRDNQGFDVSKDKIGGAAGIRRDNKDTGTMKIGGAGGVRRNERSTDVENGMIGGSAGVRRDNQGFDVSKDKIGGAAGIRRDNKDTGTMKIGGAGGVRRNERSTDVENGMIGGPAGVRPQGINPPNAVWNGGNDVKPWKTVQPNIRQLTRQQRSTDVENGMIGGSAGIRRDNQGFDVSKDKIGGAAGIRRQRSTDVKNGMIGGPAGVRPQGINPPNAVWNGGNDVKPWKTVQPNIRQLTRQQRSTDVENGMIGGSAGVRPHGTNPSDAIWNGGNNVKPWKVNQPTVGGRVN